MEQQVHEQHCCTGSIPSSIQALQNMTLLYVILRCPTQTFSSAVQFLCVNSPALLRACQDCLLLPRQCNSPPGLQDEWSMPFRLFRVPCLPPADMFALHSQCSLLWRCRGNSNLMAASLRGPHCTAALSAAVTQPRPSAEPDAAALQSASDWTMPCRPEARAGAQNFFMLFLQCCTCTWTWNTPSSSPFCCRRSSLEWLHRWSAKATLRAQALTSL